MSYWTSTRQQPDYYQTRSSKRFVMKTARPLLTVMMMWTLCPTRLVAAQRHNNMIASSWSCVTSWRSCCWLHPMCQWAKMASVAIAIATEDCTHGSSDLLLRWGKNITNQGHSTTRLVENKGRTRLAPAYCQIITKGVVRKEPWKKSYRTLFVEPAGFEGFQKPSSPTLE